MNPYQLPEADVRGGEAAALPCFYRGRLRECFLPQHAFLPPIFAVIDIAARPEVYYRHGEEGKFIVRSGNSARSEKAYSYI